MGIYERLKALCKMRGISIKQLESELGFARSSLCKIDTNAPGSERLQKLAEYFGVTPDYILHGEDSVKYYESEEAARIANRILNDPTLRALMLAAEESEPEDMILAEAFLRRAKRTNPDG